MAGDQRRSPQVRIVDFGPRDGLQNEAAPIPTDVKVRFVDLLSEAGLPWIEITPPADQQGLSSRRPTYDDPCATLVP
jgi:isopropylmalate/homocitrate/citramalate synthase